jgi:hypothetical protein
LLLRPNSWFETEIADRRFRTDGGKLPDSWNRVNNEKTPGQTDGRGTKLASGKPRNPSAVCVNEKPRPVTVPDGVGDGVMSFAAA